MMADYFASASQNTADRTKALLDAVAQGGTAGYHAFEEAEKSLQQGQAQALARAQERARIIGGPEAQGFEAISAAPYERGLSDLGVARDMFGSQMATRAGAVQDYLRQVQAGTGLVKADADRRLAAYQADHDKAASEESEADQFTKLMGGTMMAMEDAKKRLPGVEEALGRETALQKREAARIKQIDEWMKTQPVDRLGDIAFHPEKHPGVSQKEAALASQYRRLLDERTKLITRSGGRKNRVAENQSQFDALSRTLNDPTSVSRELGTALGLDPLTVYGKMTEAKWNPILNAIASQDRKGISEQATALQRAVHIAGGAEMVQSILDKPFVQETIQEARQGGYENMTWEEAKTHLADSFLKKGQDRTYAVLVELLKGLPWKKKAKK